VFSEARRLTTWHYHWMILNEFLPLFVGQDVVEDVLFRGRTFYRPRVGFIPVEFQGAAYRFGHTMGCVLRTAPTSPGTKVGRSSA